jgi:hypothetical protein
MTLRAVPEVEPLDVSRVDPVHRLPEVRPWRFDEQVIVVSHEAVRVADQAVPLTGAFETGQEPAAPVVIQEDGGPEIPTRCDVVDGSRNLFTTAFRHAATVRAGLLSDYGVVATNQPRNPPAPESG